MNENGEEVKAAAEEDTRGQLAQLRRLLQLANERQSLRATHPVGLGPVSTALEIAALERAISLLEGIRSGWETPEKVTSTERPAAPWFAIQMGKPSHGHLDFFVMDAKDNPVARILVLDNPIGRLIAQLLVRAEDVAQLLATLHGIAMENEIRIGAGTLGVVAATLSTVGIKVKGP